MQRTATAAILLAAILSPAVVADEPPAGKATPPAGSSPPAAPVPPAASPKAGDAGTAGPRGRPMAPRGAFAAERKELEYWRQAVEEVAPELSPEVLEKARALRADFESRVQAWRQENGERLRTPELEAWVARIGADARGFHYGRLDVRFPDEAACLRGEGGRILDVNGVVSESTNMYDPSWGALRAWRLMKAHWREAFRIGAANRRAGVEGLTLREVLRRRRAWRRTAPADAVAD